MARSQRGRYQPELVDWWIRARSNCPDCRVRLDRRPMGQHAANCRWPEAKPEKWHFMETNEVTGRSVFVHCGETFVKPFDATWSLAGNWPKGPLCTECFEAMRATRTRVNAREARRNSSNDAVTALTEAIH